MTEDRAEEPLAQVAIYSLLAIAVLAGLLLAVLQLPGTWLILAAAVAFDASYGWQRIGVGWLVGLAVVASAAEVFELLSSAAMARRAGAGHRASLGAVIGGFVGMFVFSLPLPIVGTIAGGLIGCFAGACAAQWTAPGEPGDAVTRLAGGARVGVFAAIGRLFGLIAKTSAAVVMAGTVVALALF
ncbi:MAG: DUF456 domain-containing protein [Phycisphaerae bacterium]|nr:DUF456 domain-containing protein [Phycisphaerae bacterium]